MRIQTCYAPRVRPTYGVRRGRAVTFEAKRALLLWFGDSKVVDDKGQPLIVYHGTARGDRVGSRFRKSRATSGPMSYFTDDVKIAEGYSRNKHDTSLSQPENYRDWFVGKPNGKGREVNLRDFWWSLTSEQQRYAKEALFTVGHTDYDRGEGPIVRDSKSILGRDHVIYSLREAQGNALEAAKDIWLDSGRLFGEEVRFLEVLSAMGVQGLRLVDPLTTHPKVFAVYLHITNPLATDEIPIWVAGRLSQAGNKSRKKAATDDGRGIWNKNTQDPKFWLTGFLRDYHAGKFNSFAWAVIPDWVTKTLIECGYDGIQDTGGKHGGRSHTVWIPFDDFQVKSAVDNKIYSPATANIYKNPSVKPKLRGLL